MEENRSAEKIIMQYSNRDAEFIRDMVHDGHITDTAKKIMSLDRGTVLITTGVMAGEHMETDGPVGAYFLACTLRAFGFRPMMVVDECSAGLFREIETRSTGADASAVEYEALLEETDPKLCISVRRCGITASGVYRNDAGFTLKAPGAHTDMLFDIAHSRHIPSVAVCRSAYEIGIGKIYEKLRKRIDIDPCVVHCDDVIIASMANWGAYALIAEIMKLTGVKSFITPDEAEEYAGFLFSNGCVDDLYTDTEADVLKALSVRVQDVMSPRMRRIMGWAAVT